MKYLYLLLVVILIGMIGCQQSPKVHKPDVSEESISVSPRYDDLSRSVGEHESVPKYDGQVFLVPQPALVLNSKDISNVFPIEHTEIRLASDFFRPKQRTSRGIWEWSENDQQRRLNVVINANPSPGDLVGWGEISFNHFLKNGTTFSDGRQIVFEEINVDNQRMAYAPSSHMLKWYIDDLFSVNVTGMLSDFDQEDIIAIAKIVDAKIKDYVMNQANDQSKQ